MTNFIVVDDLSAYNVILGRPTLNQARSVMSTYSLVVKFPTPQGTGILKGDQATARSCYVTFLHRDAIPETLTIEEIDLRGQKDRTCPVEELIQIVMDLERPDRSVSIGSLLEPELRGKLTQFLRQNNDIFA